MYRQKIRASKGWGSATFPMFYRVHNALSDLDIEPYELYRELGWTLDADKQKLPLVTMNMYISLLNIAAKRSKRPCLGIDIAKVRDINSYDILSYVLKNSPTFAEVVRNINDYARTVTPGAEGSLRKRGKLLEWRYGLSGFPHELVRHEVEMTIMEIIDASRVLLAQPDWSPERVYLQHRSCGKDEFVSSLMGCEIVFSHHESGLLIDSKILKREIEGAEHGLYQVLLAQIDGIVRNASSADPFLDEIDFYLSVRMGIADCSAKAIASEMSMSLRSFYRRLDESGLNFSQIKERKRFSIAKQALSDGDISIGELAFRLGYSDVASFHRAFKRVISITPSKYRSLHRSKSKLSR